MKKTVDNRGKRSDGTKAVSRVRNIVYESSIICKIVELIICSISIGLILEPFRIEVVKPDDDRMGFINVSLWGYILINVVTIICYCIKEYQPKGMSIMFSTIGSILCFVSGLLIIDNLKLFQESINRRYYRHYEYRMVIGGVSAILASVVFVIDAIVTYRYD